MISADQLREYASRDWRHFADLAIRRTARRWRVEGPLGCLAAAERLYEHARRSVPGFPSEAAREKDHADHLALLEKLDEVADLFTHP